MITKDDLVDAFSQFEPEVVCMTNEEYEEAKKLRTHAQNDALHAMFRDIATECQVTGQGVKVFTEKMLKQDFPVTEDFVKTIYKDIMEKLYGVRSTTKLSKKQFSEMTEIFQEAVKQRLGIHVGFGHGG